MRDLNKILNNLDQLLLNSFSKIPKHQKLGVLFSAGVDSSLVVKYAKDFNLHPTLFTFGTDYSKDKDYAQRLAQDLRLLLRYLNLSKNKIEKAIPKVKQLLMSARIEPNIMQVSLSLGFYLISNEAKKVGVDLFLSGQGSDELFGGYNKYLSLSSTQLVSQMQKDTDNLFKVDVVRDRIMTNESGIEIYFPYLDKEFIKYSQSLPRELKIHGDTRKYILRKLAKHKGLPDYIFNRPKNALQYSSGIQKIVEKIMKKTPRPDK